MTTTLFKKRLRLFLIPSFSTLILTVVLTTVSFDQPVVDEFSNHEDLPSLNPKIDAQLLSEYIAKHEYFITFDSSNDNYQSFNREQNIRADFKAGYFNMFNPASHEGEANRWQIGLKTLRVKGDNQIISVANSQAVAQVENNKLTYNHGDFEEQYVNTSEGVRQNFIVKQAPIGTREISIDLAVDGMDIEDLGNDEIVFTSTRKTGGLNRIIRYTDLNCWDANGQNLAANLTGEDGHIAINVDVLNAKFPVTIDPISSSYDAILESDQTDALMGMSVSSAGDVNGDGYSDIIIGVPNYNNGETNEGAAFIFHGGATGINTTAAIVLECNQADANFGISVANAGDVNRDGYSDVIVGANLYDNGQSDEGSAFIYHGSNSGIGNIAQTTLESDQANANFGISVSLAGDVNADGFSDVIVGASAYDNVQANEGAAFIYHGSFSGVNSTAAATLEANQDSAAFGFSTSSAGDVNGDGYADVIVGAYQYDNGQTDEGRSYVYHGSVSGINTTAASTIESNQASANLGYSVSAAGDVNGDGYADVIIGSHKYDNGQTDEGVATVYHGSASGINTTAVITLQNDQASAYFGTSVECAGDINGDGYADVIVGSPEFDNGQSNEGVVFVYLGSSSGINATSIASIEGGAAGAKMGTSVASAGDVNGDGYSDILAGAPYFNNGQSDEGVAFCHHGSASGIEATVSTQYESNQAGAKLGQCVASAGDVNGDGYTDLLVGAPLYSNGQNEEGVVFVYHGSATGLNTSPAVILDMDQSDSYFGYAVNSAGDVNGDGYDDVIVGACYYDNGQYNEGAAFIYHGSASGLTNSPATSLEENIGGSYYGLCVSSAGDVNGDGYSDVVVGAIGYSNGQSYEGTAFVYHGSAAGISTIATTKFEENEENASFGYSVSAGDFNGDGYSDIIVGASNYTNVESNEGAAYVYHGSDTGVSTTYAMRVEGDQAVAQMGISVSYAGDVNGDGYSDAIVGVVAYANGESNEGAGFIYHGSASGIGSTPNAIVESNQVNSNFGLRVAYAGDVNGDGYSDVIVGAYTYDNGQTDEGAAFIYHGSPSGINTTAAKILEENNASAYFGFVGSAGDYNSDGFSDVVVGATQYTNGQTDEGGAFAYYGNSGNGIRNNLRMYNHPDSTLYTSWNFDQNTMAIGLSGKSFLGRDSAILVYERISEGSSFTVAGGNIANSVDSSGCSSTFADLGINGSELKVGFTKTSSMRRRLRARFRYPLANSLTGQVYSPWRYEGSSEQMHSVGALPVDWLYFEAEGINDNQAKLTWATANENNNLGFYIERSTNGQSWESIGFVSGTNQMVTHTYYFIDVNPFQPVSYYRLKQVDYDGKYDYSKLVVLHFDRNLREVNFYPNPATDGIEISIPGNRKHITLDLVDVAGKVVRSQDFFGSQTYMSVSDIETGIYFLQIIEGDQTSQGSRKVVIR